MALYFPSFVARRGTEDIPLIGLVSTKMQCLYVDRETANEAVQGVGAQVKARMQRADQRQRNSTSRTGGERPMLLFPEGTTTNGRYLLPFKKGAFLAGLPLQPVVLRYGEGSLPVYAPSEAEAADPVLYARNMRAYMVRTTALLWRNEAHGA
ncbi:hypothetical protein WJX81_005850 [Elliptochloris bilobata]|uniref:Phospholipid/glycerol acyltransferase domain-containing protein n=1 Tax=Elliptochloris bilobata TaxID=381761 RepID=A0AAW1S0M5_9CHLO